MARVVQWFNFDGKLHAVDAKRSEENDALTARCGKRPLAAPAVIDFDMDTDVPDGACRQCLVNVALEEGCSEEPFDEAIGRGFLPVREDDLARRGVI